MCFKNTTSLKIKVLFILKELSLNLSSSVPH